MENTLTTPRNVLGEALTSCSLRPLPASVQDRTCTACETASDTQTAPQTVCAVMTMEFLEFSRRSGKDLLRPQPEAGFPGLQVGDRWCVGTSRWLAAFEVGMAPPVVLEASHERALEIVELPELQAYATAR